MKKLFKKWLDNLMWKLRYIPMERIAGGMLIANNEKFELVILRDDHVLSERDVFQSGVPWERHREYIEREMQRRIGEKVFSMGEVQYETPISPGNPYAMHRLRFRIFIAVKKK
jgi:hypothetical protein